MRLRFWQIFKIVKVSGNSMKPSFETGNYLLFRKVGKNTIVRGTIILYKYQDKLLVKRVVGLANEYVEIENNLLVINGEQLKEGYLASPRDSDRVTKWQVGDEEYLLLGDNPKDSLDSRTFNSVALDQDVYRFSTKLWPRRA